MLTSLSIAAGQIACQSASPSPSVPAPRRSLTDSGGQPRNLFVSVGESFSPRTGAVALHDFRPDVAPVDSGGECVVGRTPGSSATVVQVYFPSRAAVKSQMSITFDSSGRLVRVSDRWGVPKIPSTVGMAPAQRDSTLRSATASVRSTSITLDYAVDQAFVLNRGGGRPTDAIMGPVRDVERLPQLGPPAARLERARKLCGV